MAQQALKGLGYVLRKFPVLSETFVLNEILALEGQGTPVHVFSLAPPRDSRFHESLARLKAPVWYVPGVTDLKGLLRYNVKAAKRFKGAYVRTLLYVLRQASPSLLWRFLQAAYIAEKARRLHLRHLHAHFATKATSAAFLASMIGGAPYSFTAHAYDIYKSSVSRRVLARKASKAAFVVTISETNKRYLDEVLNGCPADVFLVRNGIDLSHFAPAAPASGLRGPFTILTVARLIEKKGVSILVEACRHLRDRGLAFECLIVGQGRLRARLHELIGEWQLGDRVRLLGPRTQGEVLELYRAADLFVLPCIVDGEGNREGLPVSIVEALACALPVVSTPVAGIPEAVRDGDNGLLVPQGDALALADAIASLIADRDLYDRLRANARASVAESFDLARTATSLRRLFEGARP